MCKARAACLIAALFLVCAASAPAGGQSAANSLFVGIVRVDGVLVPLAVHNGAEWWGGWPPSDSKGSDELPLPAALSATPAAWLPPGLNLPVSWTLFTDKGESQEVKIGGFTRPDSIMSMIGLTTNFQRPPLNAGELPGPTEDEAGVAVAGDAQVGGVEVLDATSADWQWLWPHVRARVNDAEVAAIPRWVTEQRHGAAGFTDPVPALERANTAPQMVHLARMRRRTDQGTWYHFVAHKRYGTAECAPLTDITGVVVRDAGDVLTVKKLQALVHESCGVSTEPSIVATLHWAGPVVWIARQDYEDGFAYFLYDPETDSSIELRGALGDEEPMRSVSIPFFDDAAECDFAEFRRELSQAVTKRDWTAIQTVLEPGIQVTQNDRGLDAFNRHWRPAASDSPMWPALDGLMRLGGACRARETFVTPYVSSVWWLPVQGGVSAVIARDVPLRQQPSADAAVLATLDYAMVRPIGGGAPLGDWVAVDAGAGQRGYLEARYLWSRSPLASFSRHGKSWRMSSLIAPEP